MGLLRTALLLLLATLYVACSGLVEVTPEEPWSDLVIEVTAKAKKCARSKQAALGQRVWIHYEGYFPGKRSKPFDSSRQRDKAKTFELGLEFELAGWNQGIEGMCVGEKRRLKIPSRLAFGATGSPSYPTVPPNAPVIYDIELLSIGGPPPGPQAPDAPPERVPQAYEDYDDEL